MNEKFRQPQTENTDRKTKVRNFWKQFGFICFAAAMAIITVLIINL